MKVETKEIYSELYQILNLLGDEYINKLPNSLFNMIKEKRSMDYNPKYTEDTLLNKQNIKHETMSIIALLYLNYWCDNGNEQLKVKQILKNNENKFQEEIKNKYNEENLFKNHNKEQKIQEKIIENQFLMVEYKEPIFKKIINNIKNFFHII